MAVHNLRPRKLGPYDLEYHRGELGDIEVIVWRDECRHDGFMIRCRDWQHVHKLMRVIRAEMSEGAK